MPADIDEPCFHTRLLPVQSCGAKHPGFSEAVSTPCVAQPDGGVHVKHVAWLLPDRKSRFSAQAYTLNFMEVDLEISCVLLNITDSIIKLSVMNYYTFTTKTNESFPWTPAAPTTLQRQKEKLKRELVDMGDCAQVLSELSTTFAAHRGAAARPVRL